MSLCDHPAFEAMHEITAIKQLVPTNPYLAKRYGIEFHGEQENKIIIDNLLAITQKHSSKDISLEELESIMPALCKIYHLEYDGLFITLL